MKIKVSNANTPNWKEVTVKSHIPEELKKLEEMARNIWWAWNYEATDLFRDLDPATWKEVGQNPVALLERLSYEKLEALTQDKVIVKRMNDVYAKFKAYVDAKPDSKRPSVAYFCMEYGLTHVLKIYSGGLGILAGDYLKEASDSNVDMCGVGFLYRYGYFSQSLSMDGQQIANYESQNFGSLPIERVMDENGQPMVVDVPYLNYFVHAYVWKVNVGRVPLYLLDTDNEMNSEFDRPITHVLKIYSGGLGILAGDYLKEASDSNVDMCGVGFLYRYGYFSQSLSMDGQQIANYESQNFGSLPIERVMDENGQPMVVDVPYLNYFVHAYVWKVNVGRVPLYLLDTDNEMNSEFDRPITYQLYGGDWENRLKQEILLGIGGVLLLKKLGIKKDVYHCNEGHAALCNVQRLCDYVESGLTFDQALEVVRSSSLYTVHTPVPAGHDYFDEGLFGKYMGGYPQRMGISWQDLMDLGRINPGDAGERFCMSTFACNTCQEVNGVSWLHGKVSQEMFSGIWKGYFPEESHVGYVTNGVHFPTWSATEWKKLYAKHFAPNFLEDQSNEKIWEAIYNVADEEIWETRMALKYKLVDHIRKQFSESWLKNQGDPSRIVSLMEKINPNALLIGFARRFATYKRAHLLFTDLERLSKIVNNPDYPVQFLFAGKAHPHDGAGQGLIKKIVEISRRPEFLGKIIFLENYDMQLARRLVSGVDIWMNTPTRPLEASGTSGEKALMNGVVNFSVLDGWWLEGYREGAGWALTEKRTYQNQDHQDQLDAATIYSILENEILPLYYARNRKGYSEGWVKTIKNSIAQVAPHYTMKRQLDDYYAKFYTKEAKRFKELVANDYAKAKELAAWKERVAELWDSIEIVSCEKTEELASGNIESGKEYIITYVIDEKGLDDAVGIELVTTFTNAEGKEHIYSVEPMEVIKKEGNLYTFQVKHSLSNSGSFKVAYRMFPKNVDLPHRQDFCYVRWFN